MSNRRPRSRRSETETMTKKPMIRKVDRAEMYKRSTSLAGYVETTIEELEAAFGPCHFTHGDKSTHEWIVEIDGVIVTVYDYKWVAQRGVVEHFHVGGEHEADPVAALQKIFPWAYRD